MIYIKRKNDNFIDKYKSLYLNIFGTEIKNFIPINEKKDMETLSTFINMDDINDIINNKINNNCSNFNNIYPINLQNNNNSIYQLSYEEKKYCIMISKNILFHNLITGVKDLNFSKRNSLAINIQGKIGELAVIRLLNLPCNIHFTYPRSNLNDNFDGIIYNKYKIDVKTIIKGKNHPLLVMEHKKSNPADFYILTEIECMDKNFRIIDINNMIQYEKDKIIMDPNIYINCYIVGFATKEIVFNSKKQNIGIYSYSNFFKVNRKLLLDINMINNYINK